MTTGAGAAIALGMIVCTAIVAVFINDLVTKLMNTAIQMFNEIMGEVKHRRKRQP